MLGNIVLTVFVVLSIGLFWAWGLSSRTWYQSLEMFTLPRAVHLALAVILPPALLVLYAFLLITPARR